MTESHSPPTQLPQRDWLLTRPSEEPLPTQLDPHDHGTATDPKPTPQRGQGDPDESNPAPDDLGRSA